MARPSGTALRHPEELLPPGDSGRGWSGRHLVGAGDRQHVALPHPGGAVGVDHGLADHGEAEVLLGLGGARLAVELHGEAGHIADEHVEGPVDEVVGDVVDGGVLEDECREVIQAFFRERR